MMLPASTSSPPKRFTPSIFGLESRPLRDEPPDFLWAIVASFDLYSLVFLARGFAAGLSPVAAFAAVFLAGALALGAAAFALGSALALGSGFFSPFFATAPPLARISVILITVSCWRWPFFRR